MRGINWLRRFYGNVAIRGHLDHIHLWDTPEGGGGGETRHTQEKDEVVSQKRWYLARRWYLK